MNDIFHGSVDYSVFVHSYSYLDTDCALSLGISRGDVKDNQLTASSTLSGEWLPKYARLNGRKAWCGKPNDKSDKDEYLQIDLGKVWLAFTNTSKALMLLYAGGIYEEVFLPAVSLRRRFP